ncbi:SPOR domain-containing protein [Candidatus Latescibacterota bacterium]
MSYFRFIMIVFIAFSLTVSTFAVEHRVGITGGTSLLYGDLDKTSDPGPSVRALYEMVFNPILSIGIEGGFQQVEGKTWIIDTTSKYYGAHPYKTTILPGGLFAKLRIPGSFVQPYIEGGGGFAFWYPEETEQSYYIPMDKKIVWSVDPFAGIGGGVFINLGEKWGLDIGARSRFFFTDNLDNINGEHLTGSKNANDFNVQGGISLVYTFGSKKKPVVKEKPVVTFKEPESIAVITEEKAVLIPDRDKDGIPDTDDAAPDEPEDFDGFEDDDGKPDPDNDNDGIPDISDGAPIDAEDIDNFEDEDGIPDLDNDEDGIVDADDPFPNIPQQKVASYENLPYSIHVSSYRSLSGAEKDIQEYLNRGYDSFSILHSIPDIGNMHRVYVGHFKTQDEAAVVAAELIKREFTDYAKVTLLGEDDSPQTKQNINYFIHVSSFKNEQNAINESRAYIRTGYQAKSVRVNLDDMGIWYRVYLGPYASHAEALQAAEYIKEAEISNYTAIIAEQN